MFRALLALIIRSVTTVYAAPGTSFTSDNLLPTWQFITCHVGRWLSDVKVVSGAAYTVVTLLMMGARIARSEIKVTNQLHRVGLFDIGR